MKSDVPQIEILLATYITDSFKRGPEFLKIQLESLLNQTYTNYKILIRDDGSTQEALDILNSFETRSPDKIQIFRDDLGNIGYKNNFERLMAHSQAPYIFFCDQDDIWHREKLTTCLGAIQKIELEQGRDKPILVYHNASIIGVDGEPLDATLNDAHNMDIRATKLSQLIFKTATAGFTIAANRALIDRSLPIPESAMAHDFHIGVVARAIGYIHFLEDDFLAKHRIHGFNTSIPNTSNTQPTQPKNKKSTLQIIKWLWECALKFNEKQQSLNRILIQHHFAYAAHFWKTHFHRSHLEKKDLELVRDFVSLATAGPIKRIQLIRKHGFFSGNNKLRFFILCSSWGKANSAANEAGIGNISEWRTSEEKTSLKTEPVSAIPTPHDSYHT